MDLPNGVHVSVQWGPGNYCTRRSEANVFEPTKHDHWTSETAEVMAWTDEHRMGIRVDGVEYDSDDVVIGHLDVTQVIDFINKASEMFNGE
tara:strand:+ start:79 stop:351 length:273 start_codon:yes stop_codon:yes gene_type:complete